MVSNNNTLCAVELLLVADASVTCVDGEGNPPALDCACAEDTANCLAMILSTYLETPAPATRRSLAPSLSRSSLRQLLLRSNVM